MKTYLLLFCLGIFFGIDSRAQQLPATDLYFYNVFLVNPAAAGEAGVSRLALLNRRQWVGIEGAPLTSCAALDMPIQKKFGIGVNLMHDQANYLRNIKGSLALRYQLKLGSNQSLALGIQSSVYDTYLNFVNVKAEDYTDDILMIGNSNRALSLGADFGIHYKYKSLEVGAFHSQLFNNSSQAYFKNSLNSYRLQAHYGGYVMQRFHLNKNVDVQPRIGLRYLPGIYVQGDVGCMLDWRNKIAFALTYRTQETVAASVNYKINDFFSFAYSYGYGVQGISNYSGGTHEVMLQMLIRGRDKNKEESMARKVDSLAYSIQDLQDKNKTLDSANQSLEKRVLKLGEMQITYLDSIRILRMIEFIHSQKDSFEVKPHMQRGERYVIENIFFEFNSAKIKKESEATLVRVVKYLNIYPSVHMEVDGHTDGIGSVSSNQKLSLARAKAVVKYLSAHGISASRLSYKGFGETYPVATNTTEQGRAKNRRIEFIILK
ncbi:MAG: PorP/SprF family type IX secretion system membrane protein [Flavobacteriales bacterium]